MNDPDFQVAHAAVSPESRALLEQAQARVQRMIQAREPLRDILTVLATASEAASHGSTVASILVLDGDGLLRNGASPNLPADFLDEIDRLKPAADVGTCAAAAATGEVVMTPSFNDDGRWAELRHLPHSLGFLGAWSMPIKSPDGFVLGTLGSYFREHRKPTSEELEIGAVLARIAALALCANPIDARPSPPAGNQTA